MGAREVLASWLGWFTVSQSNTISWENNYDDGYDVVDDDDDDGSLYRKRSKQIKRWFVSRKIKILMFQNKWNHNKVKVKLRLYLV